MCWPAKGPHAFVSNFDASFTREVEPEETEEVGDASALKPRVNFSRKRELGRTRAPTPPKHRHHENGTGVITFGTSLVINKL